MVDMVYHISPAQEVFFQPFKLAACLYQIAANPNDSRLRQRRLVGRSPFFPYACQGQEGSAAVTVLL